MQVTDLSTKRTRGGACIEETEKVSQDIIQIAHWWEDAAAEIDCHTWLEQPAVPNGPTLARTWIYASPNTRQRWFGIDVSPNLDEVTS
jgi:hypothetical protein